MPVPSSGGIAVGEALNLLEAYDRTGTPLSAADQGQYLHRLGEATATAFADRNRYVGDVPGVPVRELRSQRYAKVVTVPAPWRGDDDVRWRRRTVRLADVADRPRERPRPSGPLRRA